MNECVRICASGGWIELAELDCGFINGGPATQQFNTWLHNGFKIRDIDLSVVDRLDTFMREAGLINITKQTHITPLGKWGKMTGKLLKISD
jgi:hypothetical protein